MTPEEARRKYQNDWRHKNKDNVRKYNTDYWKKKAEQADSEQLNEEYNNGSHKQES